MKSTLEVQKGIFCGYTRHIGTGKEGNTLGYNILLSPNGINDLKGQVAILVPCTDAWYSICEGERRKDIGDKFIITMEDILGEKYL